MHKSFIISEEEKRRILNRHQTATSKQYLSVLKESDDFAPSVSIDEIKKYLEGKKEEIIELLNENNGDDISLLVDEIKKIEEYIKSVIVNIDSFKKRNVERDLERLKKIFTDVEEDNFTDEVKDLIEKEFSTTWASISSTLIGALKNLDIKGKVDTSKIAY